MRSYLRLAAALLGVAVSTLPAAAFPKVGTFASFPGNQRGYGLGFYSPYYYGYNFHDQAPGGFYGGGNYREFYAYDTGFGFARYPGPAVGKVYYPDWRENSGQYPETPPPNYMLRRIAPVPAPAPAPGAEPTPAAAPACLNVQAPADARIWIDDQATRQTGTERRFVSPPLQPGQEYAYDLRVRWTEEGREVEQTQKVVVRPGGEQSLTFPTSALPRDVGPALFMPPLAE